MSRPRVSLYERLPEIYRIKDAEQTPPYQLKAFLSVVEEVFAAIRENIETLYHDLFIETCDDWVIPYIGDLLGTSHLKGDPATLRADVADTIALRRRKGTQGAIELLAYNLTRWAAHCVELRESLCWLQHLNHQRPDAGGAPPYACPHLTRYHVPWGGTVPVRDPATLSLLNSPFDPFAYTADLRPPGTNTIRYNLPNLVIFLWRLEDYRIPLADPVPKGFTEIPEATGEEARFAVYFDLDPLDRPVQLFNTFRFDPDQEPPNVSRVDETPGPVRAARLTTGSVAGNPEAYVAVDTYDPTSTDIDQYELSDAGLHLFVPESSFGATEWAFRGDNLCAWEQGLRVPLMRNEVVIHPEIGRVMFGVASVDERDALLDHLRVSYTYGGVGPVGAHPTTRTDRPTEWGGQPVDTVRVTHLGSSPQSLESALSDIQDATRPLVVEIQDSLVHDLNLAAVAGTRIESGGAALQINSPLIIRAAEGCRPIVRLAQPLRFRPTHVIGVAEGEQKRLTVRLEGLYIAHAADFPEDQPLIARTAVARLECLSCSLDPGGHRLRNGTRAPVWKGMVLSNGYGFEDEEEEEAFLPTPEVDLQRTVSGALEIDDGYRLYVTDSIIDAGVGIGDEAGEVYAVTSASDPVDGWGPPCQVRGATFYGRMRAEQISGSGGIWVHRLEVHNNQRGCIKRSYFSGDGDRLPPHHACVEGSDAALRFTSEWFSDPGYGQIRRCSDDRILKTGPQDDEMGAFGFLLNTHRLINLTIRFREFMPVGIRPLLIFAT
jgi:hypothetical protein